MKTLVKVVTAITLVLYMVVISHAGEKAPQSVVNLVKSRLTNIASNSIIIKAVKAENSKNKSLGQIQAMDKKWKATPGIADFMRVLMSNDCSKYLTKVLESESYYAEIFVMDNQGANVCQTDKTSDYWQGDEAKFIKSFNGGKGAIFIDEVEFDDSSQAYLVQLSLPVKDGGKTIGAITFGIDVDKME